MTRSLLWSPCAVIGALLSAAAVAVSCTSDHSGLARKDGAGGSGTGGEGGGMAVASSTTASVASVASTGVGSGSGGGEPSEPDVATSLTVVNGIVDEEAVRFCFVPYPEGPSTELPWPSAVGLGFARAGAVDLAKHIPSGKDVEVRSVTGTASAVGSRSCAELVGAPDVAVRSLGIVPASVFAEPRRLLFVAHGCAGGPTHADPLQQLVCGAGYAPSQPNAGLTAGFLSTLGAADAVRMQFVHAIAGFPFPSTVGVVPGVNGGTLQVAEPLWTLGAVAPVPPFDALSLSDLGNLANAQVVMTASPAPVKFSEAFANGSVAVGDVTNGDGLVFVAVGAYPGLPFAGKWWRPFTFVALHLPK